MLSSTASTARNPLLETNPVTSPTSKFKSFSKEIDRDLSQDYIRRQLYAYGILHTQATSVASSANANASTSKRADTLRGETSQDNDALFAWKQLRTTTQIVYQEVEGRLVPSLRAPFSSNISHKRESDRPSLPRWPKEVESIDIPLSKLLPTSHSEPIKIKKADTPLDTSPIPEEAERHVVYRYHNCSSKEKCFTKSRIGASHSFEQAPSRSFILQDRTLKFEARFESGNLRKANQVGEHEYELYLQHDLYTGKYAQWFFFQVQNMLPGVRYRFVIMNLFKPASLYGEGLRPLLYSEKETADSNSGWTPHGENVFYYKNHLKYRVSEKSTKEKSHYSLSWTCEFPHAEDTCYFAHCYPYTYSHLQAYLDKLHSCPLRSKICRQKLLCTSLAGNMVHLLTITNPSPSPAEMKAKRAVVISARVHPGETNSSFMMKGVIDFLTDPDNPDANLLRNIFVFKIVPMLNPDGVIVGNYRCSLSGCDLNRQYNKLSSMKEFFPVIFHLRQMLRKLSQEREVLVYCDLHGHSRKQNIFMYGCDDRRGQGAAQIETGSLLGHIQARVLPFMLNKNAPHLFSYRSSRFKVQKYKEGCGRIAIWKDYNVKNSFTMEASFCGSSMGKLASCYFRPCDLEEMGHQLCDTFLDYFDPDPYKREKVLEEILDLLRLQVLQKLEKQGKPSPPSDRDPLDELDLLDELSLDSESDGGSDSSVSDGTPAQCKALNKKRVKKKRKSKRSRNKNKDRRRRVKAKLTTATITVTEADGAAQLGPKSADGYALSLHARTRRKEGASEVLKSTKEYSSYGSALNEAAFANQNQTSASAAKYKNRNGGIPVFSRERIAERNARKARESSTPLSGAHSSMPDIAKSGRASAESFSHDFLKHLPVVSRENACVPGHRFSSIPSHLNNARMEVFSPLCKPPEDGYQSDCESDASQMQNPASLIISKVPTAMYTGFASSYLSQYLSEHSKEASAPPHKQRNSVSSANNAGDITQALWPTSKAIPPQNPKNMVYTSFVSEQKMSDPQSASNSSHSLHKPKPPQHKPKPTPSAPVTNSPHLRTNGTQKDSNKLEDIRRDIDFLFQSKQHKQATSQVKQLKNNSKPVHTSKNVPTYVPSIPPVPSTSHVPSVPAELEKSPVTPKLTPNLPLLTSPNKPTLLSDQDPDVKKLSLEIPKEHSHSFLPVSKQTPTHPLLPAPSSKEKSPLDSKLSILPFSPPAHVPSLEAGFSAGQLKQAPVSLREQRINNAVHNIAELPEHPTRQTGVKPQRSRTRADHQTATTTLNNIDMVEHYSQIDTSLNKGRNEGEGRHSVALAAPYTTHSPVPAHISKLMQSGRKTSVGVVQATPVPTNTSVVDHFTHRVICNKSEEPDEAMKQTSKQVFISLSTGKGKGPITIPYPSHSFMKSVVHTQPPPSPRRTPSPCKKSRLN